MAKATKPRYLRPGSIRRERIINFPRKLLRRGPTEPPSPNTILTEAGDQLLSEAGQFLRTEQ